MIVLVRFHEIALKGRNRPFFVEKLLVHLRRATADLGTLKVRSYAGRVEIEADDDVSWPALRERIERSFGVANFSRVHEAPRDLEGLRARVLERVAADRFASFRITTRRSDKAFPHRSAEIDRDLGAAVGAATGARVDLGDPERTIWVEVLHDRILFSFERLPGPGGFPVGASGRVLALLSGGIDSPVAAWRLMKRGCTVQLVNFHAFPLQDRTMIDKVQELACVLARWQLRVRLLLVPFAAVQQEIVAGCPAPLRVVLYRRFMLRIAEAHARRLGAKALVTGESLGQVASQTLDNIAAIDEAARMPVLRPLVGMDKQEITAGAQALGTLEISTRPDQDCCQLFVPRNPAVAADLAALRDAESGLDSSRLVSDALHATEERRFEFPAL
ncbi:MAG TPA: tRNA uracil 4-sulfurtransferase ThiI [Vicinamibacteria bacterium]|nr:tRNA uracil 4-sulfurtransferase ThiI [Vicinamibacteria bacterium]